MPPKKKTKVASATARRTTTTSTKRKADEEGEEESHKISTKKRRQDDEDDGFTWRPVKSKESATGATRTSPRNITKNSATTTIGTTPRTNRPLADSHHPTCTSGSDSFVKLPVSDTPIIRKNQQFRQHGGDGRRRSSLSMRGKRASSMSNGLQSLPHPDIPAKEFYKHISADLSDPLRMKQLLAWCARRAIDGSKTKQAQHTTDEALQAANIARTIEEEVLKDLIDGRITTSWYHKPDQPQSTAAKQPHPQNLNNAAKMAELEEKMRKLEDEEVIWTDLLATHARTHDRSVEAATERFARSTETVVDLDLLPAQEAEFMHALTSRSETTRPNDDWIEEVEANLEFNIDSLFHALHVQQQYIKQAEVVSTSHLQGAAKALAAFEAQERQESKARGIGTIDVLRQISRSR